MNKTKMDTSDMDKKIHYMDNFVYIFASQTEKCSYKSIFHLRIPNRMHFMGKKNAITKPLSISIHCIMINFKLKHKIRGSLGKIS